MSSETEICNLLYRYAEMMDAGSFEEIADGLFAHARFKIAPEPTPTIDARGMLDILRKTTIRYDGGTLHTKHVITNPIVEVDENADLATCRSYYTVFQQTESLPLQAIVCGRYHDRFERVDGRWRFAERDYTMVDLIGDTSQHLTFAISPPTR